jgi:fused signal recognition particle receptor
MPPVGNSRAHADTAAGALIVRLGERLAATRRALGGGLATLLGGARTVDDALLEEIEAALLAADLGVETVGDLRQALRAQHPADPAALYAALRAALTQLLAPCQQPLAIPDSPRPFVILAVGVNGAGKTTTIAKIAHRLQREGHRVLLAAADTYRAAAVEQLRHWAERLQLPIIAQPSGADAAAVAHDAMQAAAARGAQVLIVDTAGRLQTQGGLMDELGKIKRVLGRFDPAAPHEVLLVLDAGIGQNALSQFEHFQRAVGVTGLAMTKLDGSARGGVLFALARRKRCPVRFLGVGEGLEDLRPFDAAEFIAAVLPPEAAP